MEWFIGDGLKGSIFKIKVCCCSKLYNRARHNYNESLGICIVFYIVS